MNSTRWQDQFSEEFKTLEQTFNAADSGSSMLAHALEKRIISENAYFEWALQRFELPLLKISYFGDHPGSPEIWEKYRNQFAWTQECLPFAEWEGYVYVACLEPTDFPAEMKAIPILCPLGGLQQLWQKYQSTMAFELIDTSTNVTTESAPLASENADETPLPDQMEGLLLEVKPVNLEKTSIVAAKNDETATIEISEPNTLEPLTPVTKIETLKDEHTPTPVVTMPQAPPTIRPTSAAPTLAVVAEGLNDYFFGDLEKLNSHKFRLDCSQLLGQLNAHFVKSYLLGTDHSSQFVKTIAWDQNYRQSKQNHPLSLQGHSVFRVVETTQKPFHGPIVVNDINQDFFSHWNDGIIPEHLTLIPLLHADKVIGMVLCMGNKEHYNRTSLSIAEKISEEFLKTIFPKKEQAA